MADYKLCNALPGVYPGNKEYHYGYLCEVREDGIWVDLDPESAKNWVASRRVHGPLQYERPEAPKPVEAPKAEEPKAPEVPFERVIVEAPKEPEVVEAHKAEEKPQTMKEVMEEGTGKRGRPAKAPKA